MSAEERVARAPAAREEEDQEERAPVVLVVGCGRQAENSGASVLRSLAAATAGLPLVLRQWQGGEREIQRLARTAILVVAAGCSASIFLRLQRLCGPRLCRASSLCDLPAALAHAEATLCIFTFPCSAPEAVLREMAALLRAIRCTRERLFVVAVRSGTAHEQEAFRDPCGGEAPWDVLLQYPARGYDILPFAEALASIEEGTCDAPPLSPYVTKLHTKSDGHWRWLLSACAYARPAEQHADTIMGSWSLLSHYAPAHDANTALWTELYREGMLAWPPQPCRFVAGTAFTTLRSSLEQVTRWVRPAPSPRTQDSSSAPCLVDRASAAGAMHTGRDGQLEHVLERYLGLLSATHLSVASAWDRPSVAQGLRH